MRTTTDSNYPPGFDDTILDGCPCPQCDGTGNDPVLEGRDCDLCDGAGEVPYHIARNWKDERRKEEGL